MAPRSANGCIVFSHANGFPAPTYRLLFETWRTAGYQVVALDQFGHDPAFPVSSNWPQLREELLAFALREGRGKPVHFVGHSMGGYLSLLAAAKRPDLARSVVLLDAPLVAGWRAHSVQMMKLGGLMKRLSPGRVSMKRRWQWPSREAVLAHFSAKAAFARWHPEVLRDYVAFGFFPDADGEGPAAVRLAFDREVETRIYNTLPHNLGRVLSRHPLRCPVAYIGGTKSSEGRRAGMSATRALVHERQAWIEGSHLFPMERPAETAQAVLRLLGRPVRTPA